MRRCAALVLSLLAVAATARTRATRGESPALWLQHNAVEIEQLPTLVGNARVVALGDATHGTHELFAIKSHLIPLLTDFRTIALEAPYGEMEQLGEGSDPAAVLRSDDYYFWDTEEVLAIVLWARANGVDVVGIDVAHPIPVIDRVLGYLQRVDPANDAASRYECLTTFAANPSDYARLAPIDREICRESIAGVRPFIESHRPSFEASSSHREFEDALHAARVVEQGEEALATMLANRDAAMAENIEWLARDRKVIVWGHNEHFGRTPYRLLGPMFDAAGTYLSRDLGNAYFALGSVLFDGTFNAYDYDVRTGVAAVRAVRMGTPTADDYALLFRAAARPMLLIPLRRALPAWLAAPHHVRVAGSSTASEKSSTIDVVEDLHAKFDVVLYFETSTPTVLRHYPPTR